MTSLRVFYDEQIFLAQRYGGISRYFTELVRAFDRDPSLGIDVVPGWTFSTNEHLCSAGLARRPPLRGRAAVAASYALNTWPRTRARSADIIHHTFTHPRFARSAPSPRRVVTVYDMIPELFPDQVTGQVHFDKERYVRSADLVLCISESTRRDLHRLVPGIEAPTEVVHLGVSEGFHGRHDPPLGLPRPYLLFVGQRAGYKDFEVLVQAFARLARPGLHLVAAGGGPFTDRERDLLDAAGISDRTHQWTIADDTLPGFYGGAEAFVFPSRYEGFGLPTLEAMAAGTRVVLARSSSHTEVGGEVARYFAPGDVSDLEAVLAGLLDDPEDRRTADVDAGRRWAATFSWDRVARETAARYHELADSPVRA